ncbi:MAG TPA: response regulator [Burkholderiaceae bacterium]|nr:response regulator [Burkholderiaceae bacterium]
MADAPLKILVVDDNVDSAQSMALLLQLEGHEVECAHDGAQALQRAGQIHPQVVLLDLELPQMNGYEVARALRAADGGERLLLIAISGFGRDRDRAAALDAGFDFHLTKPADPDEVIRLVAQRRPA